MSALNRLRQAVERHDEWPSYEAAQAVVAEARAFLAAAPQPHADREVPYKTAPDGHPCYGFGVNGNGQAECYWPECKCSRPAAPQPPEVPR